MSNGNGRPNIYAILELDENETNPRNIEKQLEKQKKEWSKWRNSGTPTQQAKAVDYFSYLKDIENTIKDPERLKSERKKYIEELKKEKKETYDKLDSYIKFLDEKTVSPETFKTIERQFKNKLDASDIKKRLKKFGYSVADGGTTTKKKPTGKKNKLEPSTMQAIDKLLELLNKKNLYDFLSLRRNSSLKSLQDKSEELLKQARGKTDKTNSRISELCGYAKKIFSTKEEKEKYDTSLSLAHLDKLDSYIELAGADKLITEDEVKKIITEAKKLNIDEEDVLDYIEDKAAKRKWKILTNDSFTPPKLLTCGFCGELSESENQQRCKNCGEELIQPCPMCSAPTPTENQACGKCGCSTGDAPEVKRLVKKAEDDINQQKFDDASKKVHQVLTLWPKWKDAESLLKEIQAKKNKQLELHVEISDAIKHRAYYQAENLLQQYIKNYGSSKVLQFQSEIKTNLQKAKKAYEEAEQFKLRKEYDKATTLYESALSFVSDYAVAKESLSKIPLSLPQSFRGVVKNASVHLKWTYSLGMENVSFVVMRKEKSFPHNSQDGTEIVKTANLTAIDSSAIPGNIYYYAVFPARNGVPFEKGVNAGPFLLPGNVTEYDYNVSKKQVQINWKLPHGAQGVEIWRKEGKHELMNRDDGEKLSIEKHSFLDNTVKKEITYTYSLVAVYRDPLKTNQYLYSKGTSIIVTPTSLPNPIEDLTVDVKGSKAFLKWTPGSDAVVIRQYDSKPNFSYNEVLSLNKLDRDGKVVPINTEGSAQTNIASQGNIYFVPFTIKHQTAVVGKEAMITTIKNVTNLNSQLSGQKIILTFDAPIGANHFWLSYRYDRFASNAEESGNINRQFTIEEYKKNEQLEIDIDQNKKHYITIYTYDPKGKLHSSGAEVLESCGNTETVKYWIEKKKKFLFFKVSDMFVHLESNTSDLILNDIAVVFKKGSVPIRKDDGSTIRNMKKVIFEKGIAKIKISEKFWNEEGYVKLFFNQSSMSKDVRLLPAAESKLKIQ